MSPALVKSIRALAALGGIALIMTRECQPLFVAVFVSFFALGFFVGRFPSLAKVLSAAQPYLALVVFAIAVVDFLYLSNSFLLTVAHFLLSLQGLRLLALRTNRECLGSLLVSSLMMLSASTLSVEWTYFAMLIVFLLCVVWTLMLLTLLQEADAASPRVEFNERSPLWARTTPVLRHAALAAFMIAVACCAVVFAVFPRFNLQGFRGQFLQPVHKSGFSSQVDLGSGKIFTDDSIVMRVELAPEDLRLWTGYLRGRTLDLFDGQTWKKAPARAERVHATRLAEIRLPIFDESPRELLRQVIYLESMDSPVLFMTARPGLVKIERLFLETLADGTVLRGNGDSWRVRYEVNSYLSQLDPAVVAKARFDRLSPLRARLKTRVWPHIENQNRSDRSSLLFVPNEQRIAAFTSGVIKGIGDPLQQAARIEEYLRRNFTYSLETKRAAKSESPLENFLFETKKGHCEYFAAAMCVMLRSRGIPARLTTGFLSREWNPRGHYVVVRMRHAHAWVEAFIEPYGWLGFDPSPRNDTKSESGMEWMKQWSESMDYINLRWNRYILSYDLERQVNIVRGFTQQSSLISTRIERVPGLSRFMRLFSDSRFSAGGAVNGARRTAIEIIAPFVFLIGVVWAFIAVVRSAQRRRYRDRVWFYRTLLRALERKAGPKPEALTLQEFFASAGPKLGPGLPSAEFLLRMYYRLRFDPSAALSAPESDAIRDSLNLLKTR